MKEVEKYALCINLDLKIKLLDDGITIIVDKNNIADIYNIIENLMENKFLKPSLV